MQTAKECYFDHLVIGSGLAGLSTALMLAEHHAGSIGIITKSAIDDCNSKMAQGGIACVTDVGDTFEEHLADTLEAGAHLCSPQAVMDIVRRGPERIKWLINDIGTHFTTREEMGKAPAEDGHSDFDLGREGGHHKRRILHAGDITGEEVERSLIAACRANPDIHVLEYHVAIDLISTWHMGWMGENRCIGAYALDSRENAVVAITALSTTLATGGCGKVYLYTSNPDVACGAGVAMGYRAFAQIANMEFYQFHPTILFHPKVRSFLISEALRGEGGVLKISRDGGEPVEFMQDYHPMKSLAPRDVVARAIDNELKRSGQQCAWLDMRHHDRDFLQRRFPNIFAKCLEADVDMSRDLIPVVPAAHFSCGGVKTDVNGFTGIPGLYAVGETACTGLHGANRLASNSLLEALVVPANAAEHIMANLDDLRKGLDNRKAPPWSSGDATSSDEQVVISHNWEEIRRFMWDYVGIYRTNKRLERAKTRIVNIRREIDKYYWDFHLTKDLIELRNLATVAELIIDSAMSRKESRGLHFNADYPDRDPSLDGVDTILQKHFSPISR